MALIRCPECEELVKVPKGYDRPTIRCDECGHKLRVDEPDDAPRSPSIKKKKTNDPASVMKTWGHFIPVAIVVPLSILLLLLSLFVSAGGVMTAIFGFVVSITAFIVACVLVFKQGHYISPDYLDFMGGIRWLVIFLFLGLYIMGYVCLLLYAQIMSAMSKPKVMGPYLALQVYGAFLIIAGPIAYGIGFARNRAPELAHHQDRNPIDPGKGQQNPDKGGGPVNPGKDKDKDKDRDKDQDKNKKPIELPPPRVTGDEVMDRLLAGLADPKKGATAAEQLAKTARNQHQAVVAQKLQTRLQAAELHERTPMLRALQVWGTPDQVPFLIQLLADKDINTRNEVMQVLAKIPDPRAVAPIVQCYQQLQTQYHAEQALRRMGPMVEQALWPTLKNPAVRSTTVAILREVGTLQSVPYLQAASSEFTIQSDARDAIKVIQARYQK